MAERPQMEMMRQSDVSPLLPMATADAGTLQFFGTVVTAQKVMVERDHSKIMRQIKEAAGVAGMRYVYAWNTRNKDGTQTRVSGLTIKGANELSRIFGNCAVEAMPVETERNGEKYLTFFARFTDFESGYSMVRSYQQRLSQADSFGKMGKDRAMDIVYQIGQSKAIRNVIVNSLDFYAEEMKQLAEKNVVQWVKDNRDKAIGYIQKSQESMQIKTSRLEKYLARSVKDWTESHIASLLMAIRSIEDGFATVNDIFPMEEVGENDFARNVKDVAEEKKPEPEPEPEPEKTAKKKGKSAKKDVPAPTDDELDLNKPKETDQPFSRKEPDPKSESSRGTEPSKENEPKTKKETTTVSEPSMGTAPHESSDDEDDVGFVFGNKG